MARAKLKIRVVIPALFIKMPVRMKNGTLNRPKLLTLSTNLVAAKFPVPQRVMEKNNTAAIKSDQPTGTPANIMTSQIISAT